MQLPRQVRPAFRLVELILVIVCVVILFGLFWPATRRIRGEDAASQCINNLKQVSLAVHNYASAYNNALPALTSDCARPKYGFYNGGLFVTLLPFLEQQVLYQNAIAYSPNSTWASPIPPAVTGTPHLQSQPLKHYQCPADATIVNGLSANQTNSPNSWAACSYVANYQFFGTENNLSATGTPTPGFGNSCGPKYSIGNVPDGLSNTIMFGEQFAACGNVAGNLWAYPGIGNYSDTTAYPVTPAGAGIVNTNAATNSALWAPVFANSHAGYGFTFGGLKGSIYQNNTQDPAPDPINPPYAAGLYWDAPPQVEIDQTRCDKSRL
jgi:type II secretory pathway pseudopilin PulG